MIREASDLTTVGRAVEAVRAQLGNDALADAVTQAAHVVPGDGDPATRLAGAMPQVTAANASSGGERGPSAPYLARDPIVSLVQTAIDEHARAQPAGQEAPAHTGLLGDIAHWIEEHTHFGAFQPDDPDWVIKVAESMLKRLGKGNHPFNQTPARHEISDTARIVLVGDWGTGLAGARAVAGLMATEVATALAQGRDAHVVHLGDIYYSGVASEIQRHVLDLWPVTTEQSAAGVTSWSLNGNHDMYSGGFGYFETLLTDPRFAKQHCPDDKPTSFFRLVSPSWDLVGLDTSWDPEVLTSGDVGVLEDPQATFVEAVAAEPEHRKLVLLSHHQLTSVYSEDDIGTTLTTKLGSVLQAGRVNAWWWGHEHLCMGFKGSRDVGFPRCIGHGGVPVLRERQEGTPTPEPGAWEDHAFYDADSARWARCGFAVLDLHPDRLEVRYIDDDGTEVRAETVT
jgi:hypothetical protein